MTLGRFSKENRWYHQNIDVQFKPESRKLLEEYSHIPPEDVDSHIYKMRDTLWSQAPYPCIGEFKFLVIHLPSHPRYKDVLSRLSASPPIQLLDLGCCVAQELRSLAHAGVPSSQLYGSDLNPDFMTTSYVLFNDEDSFKGTLVPANIFDESLFEKSFKGWENKFGIIHTGLFLHLFDYNQQLTVCEKIIKLLSKEKGALFLGEMVGCEGSGVRDEGKDAAKFWKKEEERKQHLHDVEGFKKFWSEMAEKTSTAGMWKVEGNFRKRPKKGEDDGRPAPGSFFTGEGIGWLTFSVERV